MTTDFDKSTWEDLHKDVQHGLESLLFADGLLTVGIFFIGYPNSTQLENNAVTMLCNAVNLPSPALHSYQVVGGRAICSTHGKELNAELEVEMGKLLTKFASQPA